MTKPTPEIQAAAEAIYGPRIAALETELADLRAAVDPRVLLVVKAVRKILNHRSNWEVDYTDPGKILFGVNGYAEITPEEMDAIIPRSANPAAERQRREMIRRSTEAWERKHGHSWWQMSS